MKYLKFKLFNTHFTAFFMFVNQNIKNINLFKKKVVKASRKKLVYCEFKISVLDYKSKLIKNGFLVH